MSKKPIPRARPCIVTALELIGLDDPATPEARARQALSSVERHLGDGETARLYETRLSLTANRVLHIAPVKRGGMLAFWSVLALVHLQADLVPHGICVRGAVTFDEAAAWGDLALGPGVSRAERLCAEIADVPRVVVDARLLREVETNPDLRAQQHSIMDELGYIRELLRSDSDGLWFVDYLSAFRSEVDEPPFYLSFLEDHQRLVSQRLTASSRLDRDARAWTWLWSYHNLVIEEAKRRWGGVQERLANLRIPATSPLVYRFPPSAVAPDARRGAQRW